MSGGFTTYDDIVNAISTNAKLQAIPFWKNTTVATTPSVGSIMSLRLETGNPGAGSSLTSGVANGTSLTSSSSGALPFTNAASGKKLYLTSAAVGTYNNVTGILVIVDFISACRMAGNANGSITGLTATGRLNSSASQYAAGCQIFIEQNTAISTQDSFTFTYTNSEGTGSRTTQTVATATGTKLLLSATDLVNSATTSNFFVSLQAGDRGARSIESINTVSGTATGTMIVNLVRPLAYIPIPVAGAVVERDFTVEVPSLERVFDSSYIGFIWIANTATLPKIFGELRFVEN